MSDEWMLAHKGQLVRTVGQVWWCGDEFCDCTQAQITDVYRNLKDARFFVNVTRWAGTFHTDGETGASEELAAKRAELRAVDPEQEARIEWTDPA